MEEVAVITPVILESGTIIKNHVEALNNFQISVDNQESAIQSIYHTTRIKEKQVELEEIKIDNLKRAIEADMNKFRATYPAQKRILEAQEKQLSNEIIELEDKHQRLIVKEVELNRQLKTLQSYFDGANGELESLNDASNFEPYEVNISDSEVKVNDAVNDIERIINEINYVQTNITRLETMIISLSAERVRLIEQIKRHKSNVVHGATTTDIKMKELDNEIRLSKNSMLQGESNQRKYQTQKNVLAASIEEKETKLMELERALSEVERKVNDSIYRKNSIQNKITDTINDTKMMRKHVKENIDIYNSNNLEKAKLIEDILLDKEKFNRLKRRLESRVQLMKDKSTNIQNKLIRCVVKLKECSSDARRLEYMNTDLAIMDRDKREREKQDEIHVDSLMDKLKSLYDEIKSKRDAVLKLEAYEVPDPDPGLIVYKCKKSRNKKDFESYDNQIKCLKQEMHKIEGHIKELREAQDSVKGSIKERLLAIQDDYQESINCKRDHEICKFGNKSIRIVQFETLQRKYQYLKEENEKRKAKILNKKFVVDNIMKEYNFAYIPDDICVVCDHDFKRETEIKKELRGNLRYDSYYAVQKIVDHLQKLHSQTVVMKDSLSLQKNNDKQNLTLLRKWAVALDRLNVDLPRNTWLFLSCN